MVPTLFVSLVFNELFCKVRILRDSVGSMAVRAGTLGATTQGAMSRCPVSPVMAGTLSILLLTASPEVSSNL